MAGESILARGYSVSHGVGFRQKGWPDASAAPINAASRREEAAEIFKVHGALSFVECWGDDVPDGEVTSFPMAVKCGKNETVSFSWVVWPSKTVRDEAMPKIMEEARRLLP